MHKWRLRCEHGHVDVVERGRTRHRGGRQPKTRFYCRSCKDLGYDPHHDRVVDAKTGREVPA